MIPIAYPAIVQYPALAALIPNMLWALNALGAVLEILLIMGAFVLVRGKFYTMNNIFLACKTLDNSCLSCNGTASCTQCSSPKYALGPKCVDICPVDTYVNSGVCTCKKDFCEENSCF